MEESGASASGSKRRGSTPTSPGTRKKKRGHGSPRPSLEESIAVAGGPTTSPRARAKAPQAPPLVTPEAATPGVTTGTSIYCVCHSSDEGFMVECSDGTGGCGGWFHPECCNLELSEEQRRKSAMKKFKFVCSLCVKVRRKAEKKKVKGKTKGRKSSSPGASDSEAIPGATPAARTAPPEDGNAQILASPSGTLGKNASTPNAVKPRSPKLKLKLKTSPPPASPPPPPPSLTVVRKDDGSDRMMGGVDEYGNESMTAFVDVGGADGEPAGSMPYVQVEPMPPPPSQPKKLKRRRLAGDAVGGPGSNGGKKNAGSGRGEEGGKARGGARRGGARAGGGGRGGRKLKRQRSSSAVPEGLDEDDSWGDESLEETNADAATRPSPYGTRDRSSRVKYVEEASDNEEDYMTDENGEGDGDGVPRRSSAAAVAAANSTGSLADSGRASSSSSLSSRAERDMAPIRAPSGDIVAGRSPPIAPQCDYIVDKILGRKVFLIQPTAGDESEDDDGTAVRKEMYLVKWKNLSYLHNSWEMAADLQDPRNPNNRQKLLRYNSKMEQEHGPQWRKVLEEEDMEFHQEANADREYFPSDMVEVQRIITCETTHARHEEVLRRERHNLLVGDLDSPQEEGNDKKANARNKTSGKGDPKRAAGPKEPSNRPEPMDEMMSYEPDDLVLYLVKWRGLPYDQASWEHFKDIRFASDQILGFWDNCRPKSKDMMTVEAELASGGGGRGNRVSRTGQDASKGHNLRVRDFSKLVMSPVFGVSSAEKLAKGGDPEGEADSSAFGEVGLTLRDYQLEGVNWLLWNWWNHRSSILADEMGLGKTIQTVGFLDQLWNNKLTKIHGPFCIVAPLSLVSQWQSEIATWSPDMNVIVYHGNGVSRTIVREREFWHTEPFVTKDEARKLKAAGRVKFHILITTYEVALKDVRELSRIHWKILVVDEAHRLKNCDSKLFQELGSLPRDHSLLLTGTPLQNRTEELWALLNFADGRKFSDQQGFKEQFGDLKGSSQVAKLHEMLRPYLLRRVKEDVEKSLPPKEETIVEVSLTPVQRQFYRAIYEKNTQFLFKGARPVHAPSLMNIMMELRKCCNHPYLNRGVEERIMSEIPDELHTKANIHKQLVDASGKMVLLGKLLPRLLAEGHKVLIFSQMVRCLDLIEDFLKGGMDGNGPGYKYERLDGNTRANMRTAAVERFNRPQFKRFIMLLSTRAGGLGLNLTSADTVIIYDSDWNPHNDLQAQARAHRIGQTKAVMVYRLLSKKTYEMHMFHQASLKLGLDKAVLAHARSEAQQGADDGDMNMAESGRGMISARGTGKMDLAAEEIDHLLKRGAYDVFREDDEEGKDFVEASIDDIMKRAATKVTYGSPMAMNKLSTSFSKASFVAKDEAEEVDLDDPDFWKKAIGLVEQAPEEEEEQQDLLGQRSRKQTKIFDPYSNSRSPSEEQPSTGGGGRGAKLKKNGNASDSEGSEDSMSDIGGTEPRDGRGDEEYLLEESGSRKDRSKRSKKDQKQARPSKPLKDWGTHNRDRLVRSLQLYGFGRWPRIRKEAGASIRSLEDVEGFARSYVLQAGVCAREEERLQEQKQAEEAGEGEDGASNKRVPPKEEDSEFVRQAMAAAKAIQDQIANGERTVDIPAVLREDKFVEKLVKQGLAKKALQRLDLLRRLQSMISKAVETVLHDMPRSERQKYETMGNDQDEQVAALTPFGLARALPLGNVRPRWAAMQSWWDLDADRDLVLGSFLHGFGAYPKMRADPRLCFASKILGYVLRHPNEGDLGGSTLAGGSNGGAAGSGGGSGGGEAGGNAEQSTPTPTSSAKSGDVKTILVMGKRLSQFKGVFSQPGSCRWVALGREGDGEAYLGTHDTEVAAAKAYDRFARKLYMAMERQAGVADPDPSMAVTNFNPDGSRRYDVTSEEDDVNVSLPWLRGSRYNGVSASGERWTAEITTSRKHVVLGSFPTEVHAALAYDDAARVAQAAGPDTPAVPATGAGVGAPPAAPSGSPPVPGAGGTASAGQGGSSTAATGAESPLPLNFVDDEEAQQKLDEIAMFEAGFHVDGETPVDPTVILVADKEGRLRRKRPLRSEAADGEDGEGGKNLNTEMVDGDPSAEANAGEDAEEDGGMRDANSSLPMNGSGGVWRRRSLRGSGTDAGGEWEGAGKRADAVAMPDVRLLNRLVQYLVTSADAQVWHLDHSTRVSVSSLSASAKNGSGGGNAASAAAGGAAGVGGAAGAGAGGAKGSPTTPRRRSTGSAIKKPKGSEEVDLRECSEERKLGLMTDRQEGAGIALVQTWAENMAGKEGPTIDHHTWQASQAAAIKEVPKAAACCPSKWTFWERKMLCAALLAQGAPSTNEDDTVHPGIIRLMQGREPLDPSSDTEEGEVIKGFNWDSIIASANLTRTPEDVALYYLKHFLPLCVELCRPETMNGGEDSKSSETGGAAPGGASSATTFGESENADASSSEGAPGVSGMSSASEGDRGRMGSTGASSAGAPGADQPADQLSFFPDPTRELADHSPVARGVAYIFLKRQQLLRTIRFFLHKRKDAVAQWSRNQQTAQVKHFKEGLPIWWCPWIHDVGLMAGCVRHGFMNINAMRSNTELPLNPSAILEHITRTFLNGRASEESPSHPDGGVVQSGDAALVSAADPGKVVNPPGSGVGGASSVGYGFLKTGKGFDPGDEAAQAWAEEASAEFPTRRSAEDRVFKICVAMTKLLPLNNPVRIRVYNERCD